MLEVVFRAMLEIVHENAAAFEGDVFRAAEGKEPVGVPETPTLQYANFERRMIRENVGTGKVYNALVFSQLRIIYELLSYLDDAKGPIDWPGIELVNAQTHERLSIDFAFDFADIEYDFIQQKRKTNASEE
jgi:hypothetical protein